ncbi:MAG: hypothetical protein GY944_23410, partial [bacterium]|nr:hypothetical protein [bacterium]
MIPLLRLLTLAILCTWVVSQDEYPRLELVYETKELARGQAVGLCYTLDGAQLVTVSRHDGVIVRDADELKVLHRFSPRDNDKIRYDTTLLYASTADSGIALLHDGRVSIWNNDGSLRETRTSKYTDRRMPVFARRSPTSFVVIRELRKATPEAESSERSILHVRRDEGWRTFDVTDLGPLRSMVIDDLAARIAVAGERVWILDIENGTVERSVAHDDVTQLCWLRDGSLWGLVAGQLTCLTRVRRHDEIRGSNLVAAVDGLHLAAVGAREIVTTDGQGRTVHRLPRRPVPVLCVAARNGREVAVSYSDGVVVVHRPRGEHTMADFTAVVCSLSFSRDSRHLAVASHELIRFMTLPAGAMRLAVEPRGFPAICPGRLGGEMIVIDAAGAHIYDAKAAQRSATFEVEVPPVEHAVVSLSPTDRELAIGSPAGRAYIVDLVNGRVAMLKSSFNDAAWSSDGTQLAAVFGNVGV